MKKKIEQLNSKIVQSDEEKQKIQKEYKTIANQYIKLDSQLKTLEQNILKLKN